MDGDYEEKYSGFEVVTRKGRKKKRQARKQSNFGDESKSGSESPLDERSSTLVDDSGVFFVNEFNCIHKDGYLGKPPSYELEEKQKTITEQTELPKEILEEKVGDDVIEPAVFKPVINTRALSKYAETYELEKFEKNALVIFNQENIDGYEPRLGTEKDVEALTRTFKKFQFEVIEHKDFTKEKIFEELKNFNANNFTDYGCVAVAVLTHGTEKGLIRAKDMLYNEDEIINQFKVHNNLTLVTKPKIIIIQACRGYTMIPAAPVYHVGRVRKDQEQPDLETYTLPVESDMLMLHSTYGGTPSHRDELHGSWFIQELCSKIESLSPTEDLLSIITVVNRAVGINKENEEYNRRTQETDIYKQMPVMQSTLMRKLFLKSFEQKSDQVISNHKSNLQTFADQEHESESFVTAIEDSVINTPLPFDACSCYLDHFVYLRKCLGYFVKDNPDDVTAQSYFELANTYGNGEDFNTAKDKMSKWICKHLMSNAENCQHYKYLYFYKY